MKELAEFLKTGRLNRNMSLEAFSELSGINIGMLISIEACDFERFGASLLIRNTIRAYCKALGREAEPLILKFSSEIDRYNIQDAGIKRYGHRMKILRKRRRMISLPLFALLLTSAAVFYGGMWISEKRARLFAPPAADRIFIQEELPVELQALLAHGSTARNDKTVTDTRLADKAMRTAEIYIRESEMAAQKAREAGRAVELSSGGVEFTDFPDTNSPAHPALSNFTNATAHYAPAQDVATVVPNRFAVEAGDKLWLQVRMVDKETRSVMLYPGDRREWVADKDLKAVIGNAGKKSPRVDARNQRPPSEPGH